MTHKDKHLFWFCVGVFVISFVSMMSLIFFEFPEQNREMAANTQGFLQGSLIMSAIGFLLTGNINTGTVKKDQKVTTEVTTEGTTITEEPINQPADGKK